ncbi:hypothetical protein [Polaribacter butkevichii]|uniref:hypothetical protein n=1 Tax=Polaribacter butkevichii TaxID=218490 RepID=UPI001FE2A189|nr:hypothetical protein [Polaribacter butkevichii]
MIIKLSIVIGCGYFIYTKLIENEQLAFSVFYQNLIQNNIFTIKNSLFLLLFTFLNWYLEASKWHLLISFISNYSFKSALIQSLSSLTTSLITPNRIGEYGAKAMYFEKKYRKQILGLNLVGNFYQMLITLFFGIIGFSYFVFKHNITINLTHFFSILLIGILIIISLIFLIKNFNFKGLSFEKVRNFIKKIPASLNRKVALISLLRFVVFSHQFYFLLLIFNVDISYVDAISAITSVYLIASTIPMLSLFDVVLKGSVAIWVFHFFNIEALIILSTTTLMWILNFVLPAIIGSYFVLTFKPNFTK